MPRYVVERSFPDGLSMPVDEDGAKARWPSSTATPPKG
jgi:hypothetical protein